MESKKKNISQIQRKNSETRKTRGNSNISLESQTNEFQDVTKKLKLNSLDSRNRSSQKITIKLDKKKVL